jgi:hypothetical protein
MALAEIQAGVISGHLPKISVRFNGHLPKNPSKALADEANNGPLPKFYILFKGYMPK